MFKPKGYFPGENPRTLFAATGEYRKPLKGEHYLSGAIIVAYLAYHDLCSPYWIAAPVQDRRKANRRKQ